MVTALLDLIFPLTCISCKKPSPQARARFLCEACFASLPRYAPPFCRYCGRSLAPNAEIARDACGECRSKHFSFDQAWAVCPYQGAIQELIHQFKYKQKLHYRAIFKQLLADFITRYQILSEIDLIVPIPLHPVRMREREYNQSYILAHQIADIIHKPVANQLLRKVRHTKSQMQLTQHERHRNLAGCFYCTSDGAVQNKSILLVDDIFTTGATLAEAADTLSRKAPCTIKAITLAR